VSSKLCLCDKVIENQVMGTGWVLIVYCMPLNTEPWTHVFCPCPSQCDGHP